MPTCTVCNTKYKSLFSDRDEQALNCAADIFERNGKRYLIGHYGSTIIDGQLYEVLTDEYENGIICDACIHTGRKKGDFKHISSNNFFDVSFEEEKTDG